MKLLRLGLGVLAIALMGVVLSSSGAGAQEALRAKISTPQITPTDVALIESIDVCNRGASSPQINVVVKAPDGEVVIDQWHRPALEEPGVIVNRDGSWSVELQLRDHAGQPTGDPFPSLGTYTVHVDCVTTYTPQVRIPYNDLSFEVVDSVTTTSTTPVTTPSGTPGEPSPDPSRPAVPVPGEPGFTG